MSPWNIMVMIMVKIATSRTGQFSKKNALLQKIGNKKKKKKKQGSPTYRRKEISNPWVGFQFLWACSGSAEGA